jgi:hypothetical protein
MSKALTEEMIFSKNRNDNLNMTKKLNMCGIALDNVKILAQMPQLEVVSLSVNNLKSLKHL